MLARSGWPSAELTWISPSSSAPAGAAASPQTPPAASSAGMSVDDFRESFRRLMFSLRDAFTATYLDIRFDVFRAIGTVILMPGARYVQTG